MAKERILLFIPAYNCEKQISRVIGRLHSLDLSFLKEILIVENRSSDNTIKEAIKGLEKINCPSKLVQNNENYNFGGSNKIAIEYALLNGFDYLIILHGDDQATINNLMPYIASSEYKNYDLFLGARFHNDSKLIGYSKFRVFGNKCLNLLVSLIYRKRVFDTSAGLNIYNIKIFANGLYKSFPNNLNFSVITLLNALKLQQRIGFFAIHWREEDQISNAKVFKQFFEILKYIFLFKFLKNTHLCSNKNLEKNRGYNILFEKHS